MPLSTWADNQLPAINNPKVPAKTIATTSATIRTGSHENQISGRCLRQRSMFQAI